MLNDVSDAFSEWLEPLTGVRPSGAYVRGRWVESIPVDLTLSGVVQVATDKDLKVLKEGDRDSEARKIHTVYQLKIGDEINAEGEVWKVYNVANRRIGNYFKVIAIKVQS